MREDTTRDTLNRHLPPNSPPSTDKKSAGEVFRSWLPVLFTGGMLLVSFGFRGGSAETEIRGLRVELAKMAASQDENNKEVRVEVRRISEALVEARGFRDGLQTRLVILEKRMDVEEERRQQEDIEIRSKIEAAQSQAASVRENDLAEVRAGFDSHRSLIENNKTAVRTLRGRFDVHVFAKTGDDPEHEDGSPLP